MMSPLLKVANLRKSFPTPQGLVHAVDDVSFHIEEGETVALVGESGCGKSTIATSLIQLTRADSGRIDFDGDDFTKADRKKVNELRRKVGFVFQNPYSSLNPKMRVRDIIGEPLKLIGGLRGNALAEKVTSCLLDVGLGPEHLKRFPHEFSGGQRQRIAIARALALEPKLVILDEPTAALDVSVQAQILNLLKKIQHQSGVSFLFISHDLAVVEYLADRALVMYLGRLVESGEVSQVLSAPKHPYTRALLDSVPKPDPELRDSLQVLSGEIPSPLNPPPGCAFEPRCSAARSRCGAERPQLSIVENSGSVACHFPLSSQPNIHDVEFAQ